MKNLSNLGKGKPNFSPHECEESGGKYQEMKDLWSNFAEGLPGTRMSRLHGRDYKKTNHKEDTSVLEELLKPDTHGPPFENVSVPRRIL